MLLKAHPYHIRGTQRPGKYRVVKNEDADHEFEPLKTFCGLTLETCPGELVSESPSKIDCQNCLSAMIRQVKHQEWLAQCQFTDELFANPQMKYGLAYSPQPLREPTIHHQPKSLN
jgi:hypothetical protein